MDIKELVEILIAPACMVILAAILNRKDTAFKLQLQTNEKKGWRKKPQGRKCGCCPSVEILPA